MRLASLLLLLLVSAGALAQAYTWVDENGVRHYSDKPHPGAELIQLQSSQRARTTRPRTAARSLETTPAGTTTAEPVSAYRAIEIVRPSHQEVLWNIGGELSVALRLRPGLQVGHRVRLVYDGATLDGLPTNSQDLQLSDVFRGVHTLQAVVEDSQGTELARSRTVTFNVQATSILNPQRPAQTRATANPSG